MLRHENEWPLARTRWTRFYLDPVGLTLSHRPVAREGTVAYETPGNGVTFWMPPLAQETEITRPVAARLFVSSSTRDADLFLIVRVFDPSGKELTFMGSTDPNTTTAPVKPGPATTWFNLGRPLLAGEDTSPLVLHQRGPDDRLLACTAASVDPARRGDACRRAGDGRGPAALSDLDGPFGRCEQTLIFERRVS